MSHFTVGVITETGKESEVDDLLAPFDENLEVISYESKEELIQKEKEWMKLYEEGGYREYLKDPEEYERRFKDNPIHLDYIKNELPLKLKRTDEEIYQDVLTNWEEEDIMPDGSVRIYYNPKSKWDWYQIGGRWKNSIPLKDGSLSSVDKIKNINTGIIEEEAEENKAFWESYVEGKDSVLPENSFTLYKPEYYIKTYGTKDNYIDKESRFSTFALLTPEGEWLERGNMGWFGTSDSTKESIQNYHESFSELLNKYSDYYLTLVDCHI